MMLEALESRVGQSVRSTCANAMTLLVEYDSVLWNRYAVSADGKTPYEKMRSKQPHMFGLEFGENVLWRHSTPVVHRNNKLDSVWADGVYLGHETLGGESIVGNKDGVFKTRTVRRVPVEDRWHFGLLQCLGGTPWKVNPQAEEVEQVAQDSVPSVPSATLVIAPGPPHVAFRKEAPRKVYVKTDVLSQIGYTPGCLGCRAIQSVRPRVGHSDDCRKRAVDIMKDTVAGRGRLSAARKREDDYLALAVQQTDEKFLKRTKVEESSSSQATSPPGEGGSVIATALIGAVPPQDSLAQFTIIVGSSSSSTRASLPAPSILLVPTSSSTDMAIDPSSGAKRAGEVGDEGDQDEDRDNDVSMCALLVSECLAGEDFPASSIIELVGVVCEDSLEKFAVTTDIYRNEIASVMMQVGQEGESIIESILEGQFGAVGRRHECGGKVTPEILQMEKCTSESVPEGDRDGAVIHTIAGSLYEGEYLDDDVAPMIPPQEIANCKFDLELVGERVVPKSVLLAFVEWEEKNGVGDLIGEELLPNLVKLAKCEELSEMYRRSVWTEASLKDCSEKTGKPPIPGRWVITNKGDKKNYNVRARLVAKHLVAKYRGKGLHDLFAAMPPFEMVKLLLVRAVSSIGSIGGRVDKSAVVPPRTCLGRKVMFIDISKAHLYALINADVEAYVGLPPECHKKGVCG